MPCRIYKLDFQDKSGKRLVFIVSRGTFEGGLQWERG